MHRLLTASAPALRLLLPALLGLGASLAQAQTSVHEEVARLLRNGQAAEAQHQAESVLAQRPDDAQLRFLKGVAQSAQGQRAEASATYAALTQDYPELPEPHNNLAVLHAAAGRLDEARAELETALRLSPGYATALQNLGDVYLRLSARAWTRALELEPASPTLRPKLQLLQPLLEPSAAR